MVTATRRHLVLFGAVITLEAAAGRKAQAAAEATPPDPRQVIADAQALPGGVDELTAVEINGLKQWIRVRGADRKNPVLLFIHGGPGSPMMPEAWTYQRPWEDFFTVVQWDQRGAGKTFASARGIGPEPLTVALMVADAKAVVDHLRRTFGHDKIFVAGHSWGSVLGLTLAHDIPEMLHAYIGIGQVVGGRINEEVGYRETVEVAHRRGNVEAIKALEALHPYPGGDGVNIGPLSSVVVERHWDVALGGMRYSLDHAPEAPIWSLSPDYTTDDVTAAATGEGASALALMPQLAAVDFRSVVDYRCPLFFFAGVDDRTTPRSVIEAYFTTLHAPIKRLFIIEHAAHYVVDEAPGVVLLDLVEHIRPLALQGSNVR